MKTLLVTVAILGAPALAAAQTYPCGAGTGGVACEGAIPDLTPPDNLTSTLNVPAGTCGNSPNLGHVDVRLEILHDWRGDLTVRLDRPGGAGAEVRLASDDPNDDISQTIAVPDGAFDGLPRQGSSVSRSRTPRAPGSARSLAGR